MYKRAISRRRNPIKARRRRKNPTTKRRRNPKASELKSFVGQGVVGLIGYAGTGVASHYVGNFLSRYAAIKKRPALQRFLGSLSGLAVTGLVLGGDMLIKGNKQRDRDLIGSLVLGSGIRVMLDGVNALIHNNNSKWAQFLKVSSGMSLKAIPNPAKKKPPVGKTKRTATPQQKSKAKAKLRSKLVEQGIPSNQAAPIADRAVETTTQSAGRGDSEANTTAQTEQSVRSQAEKLGITRENVEKLVKTAAGFGSALLKWLRGGADTLQLSEVPDPSAGIDPSKTITATYVTDHNKFYLGSVADSAFLSQDGIGFNKLSVEETTGATARVLYQRKILVSPAGRPWLSDGSKIVLSSHSKGLDYGTMQEFQASSNDMSGWDGGYMSGNPAGWELGRFANDPYGRQGEPYGYQGNTQRRNPFGNFF